MIKSDYYSSIYKMISNARIEHIKNSETKEDVTAMGVWDKIKDWFCGTRKREALTHLYNLIHDDKTSDPQIILQKVKAFHHLSTMAGVAYRDEFKVIITENFNDSWDFKSLIKGILERTGTMGKNLKGDFDPTTTTNEQETVSIKCEMPDYTDASFFADLRTFLIQQNIAHPGITLYNAAMTRLAQLEKFEVHLLNQCASFSQIAHIIPPKAANTAILVLQKSSVGLSLFRFGGRKSG